MATVIVPGSAGRAVELRPGREALRRGRGAVPAAAGQPQGRGGVLGALCRGRWWRTMTAVTPEQAQASLDTFCAGTADARRRKPPAGWPGRVAALADAEPLLARPAAPFPATVTCPAQVGAERAVAFRGNSYSVPPGLAGPVQCRHRLGAATWNPHRGRA